MRLADVARVDEREVLSRIVREDQQYQRTVSYEFRGPTKLGDKVHEAVMKSTRLPAGYTLVGREEWKWSDDEKKQIYGVLAVSLVLVFMVTAALFESLRQPLCVLLTVPMALIGVFLVFFFTGASFSREAFIGVIMMGGVVTNNATLLVDHVNQLRRGGGLPLQRRHPAGHAGARAAHPDDERRHHPGPAAAGGDERGGGRQHLERAGLRAAGRAGQQHGAGADGHARAVPALRARPRAQAAWRANTDRGAGDCVRTTA